MTIQTTTQSAGRPLSTRGRKVRSAVLRYVEQADQFTARDVSRATKSNKTAVRNRLNALLREGLIRQVDSVSQGRGRPQAVYAKAEADRTNQRVVANRKLLNRLAEMSQQERTEMVGSALVQLNAFQVDAEQEVQDSIYRNAQGFTKYDAPRGMADAKRYMETGTLDMGSVNYWLVPVGKNKRPRIAKYRNQVDV